MVVDKTPYLASCNTNFRPKLLASDKQLAIGIRIGRYLMMTSFLHTSLLLALRVLSWYEQDLKISYKYGERCGGHGISIRAYVAGGEW